MKITEKQIAEFEKCRMDFLWKVQIFEMGVKHRQEVGERIFLYKRVEEAAKCNFDISEKAIMHQKVEDMDNKHFAYELGRYIESIRVEIVREMNQFDYPLDAIWGNYQEQLKKIFL